jgi:nicotinamidase-related amidase
MNLMNELKLEPQSTALVLIDLQQGVLGMPTEHRPAGDVLATCATLANLFRAAGAPVVLVRVSFSAGMQDALKPQVDAPPAWSGSRPENWDQLSPTLGPRDGDILITKRQWGAFYGTDLDLQLRRRGIQTIVIGGIATNFGVESTARDAYERGYNLVFVADGMASTSQEMHDFAMQNIFPRIGRIRSAADVLFEHRG